MSDWEEKSKSQRKRDATALQKLGEQLTKLNTKQLAELPLTDELVEVIQNAKAIKSRQAHKRQLQYIGRVMRQLEEDEVAAIQQAYTTLQSHVAHSNEQFHLIEQWRDRLISEGDAALEKFLQTYPCEDEKRLRQLVHQAVSEQASQKHHTAARALFRFLKMMME